MGWLTAWWGQVCRRPAGDPWNDDPAILRARKRQHDEGITDAAQAYRLRTQIRDHFNEKLRESWRHRP